jgi:predicted secreted acid phosphatase
MPLRTQRTRAAALLTTAVTVVAATASATSASAATPSGTASNVSAAATSSLPPYSTWSSDVTAVTDQASAYLATRLPDPSIKAAIVLDIDNTALETTYSGGIVTPATKPVLALAKQARSAGAAVIFVTARYEILRPLTKGNLQQVAYPNDGLYLRGWFDTCDNQTLKTNARIAIEKAGYTIVASIGNNTSDLAGGHAERTFKLPDYNGQLS